LFEPFEDSVYPISIILYVFLFQLHFFITEYLTKGFSPGKFFLSIKIISNDGNAPGLVQFLIRSMTKVILFIPPLFVLNELYLFTAFKKKFSDHFSNTEITSIPKRKKFVIDKADKKLIEPKLQNELSITLNQTEINLLKKYYREAKFLNDETRQNLLASIIQDISDKISISSKQIIEIKPRSLLINILCKLKHD
jgi:hypothetical protein